MTYSAPSSAASKTAGRCDRNSGNSGTRRDALPVGMRWRRAGASGVGQRLRYRRVIENRPLRRRPCHALPAVARIMVTMPALTGSGRVGHAAMTAASAGSAGAGSGWFGGLPAPTAPDSDPLGAGFGEFPNDWAGFSSLSSPHGKSGAVSPICVPRHLVERILRPMPPFGDATGVWVTCNQHRVPR